MRVTGADHVVLVVADPEASLRWYGEVLGLAGERVEAWRSGEVLFPSVRVDEGFVIDLLEGVPEGRNVDHLCLIVDDVDLGELARSGTVDVAGGPMQVWGARGEGTGLYVRDPDGHVIELRTYPPS